MWKNLCFSAKNDEKLFSLNVQVFLNWATFKVYSSESVWRVWLPKVLFQDIAEHFNHRQVTDWFYTWRRNGNFLRIWITWPWRTPTSCNIHLFKNFLRNCMEVFGQIRAIVSGEIISFAKSSHFRKMNCKVVFSTLNKTSTLQFSSTDLTFSSLKTFQIPAL